MQGWRHIPGEGERRQERSIGDEKNKGMAGAFIGVFFAVDRHDDATTGIRSKKETETQ